MYEGATDGVREWEGDSEGMHEGATEEVRGWEGDSECTREQQME